MKKEKIQYKIKNFFKKNLKPSLIIDRQSLVVANCGISIILVLLIISAVLTSAILVADVLIRQGWVIKGIESSELAFYAAESVAEKVAYKVFKEHCQIDEGCGLSGSLWVNGPTYEIVNNNITVDSATSPWDISLEAGQSFQFYLDIRGTAYPASITVSCTSLEKEADLVVFKEKVDDSSDKTEDVYTDLSSPVPIFIDRNVENHLNYYYKITLHNRGSGTQTYQVTWTGDLPYILKIVEAKGTYKGYQRLIEKKFPRWQKTSL